MRPRLGVTVVELLTVIAMIGILAALLLPAVMYAREAARKVQCKNNLRNLGLAVTQSAENVRRYPASGYWNADPPYNPFHNWVVTVLPWLEQSNLHDQWAFDSSSKEGVNAQLSDTHLAVLACPSDVTITGRGDLSYVVNMGFGATASPCGVHSVSGVIDLNGNGVCDVRGRDPRPTDFDRLFQTALFFVDNWPVSTVPHHSPATVSDGSSQTIMLSENVLAGVDQATPQTNWSHAHPRHMSFQVSPAVCESLRCSPGNVNYGRANSGSQSINASLKSAEGSPWPNSYHSGGVHVVFVDGHLQFLSESVDGRVYASLVSPQGGQIRGALEQSPISGDQF